MVEPTKVNPRRFRSLASRSDSSVRAGRSDIFRGRLTTRIAVDPVPQVRVERALLLAEGQIGLGVLSPRPGP